MAVVGYARVSTEDQNLEAQVQLLKDAGCEKIFSEKQSGSATRDRGELEKCMHYIREGDVLVVTRVDRLARSVADFSRMMTELDQKSVEFRCLLQPFDTTSPSGRLLRDMLAAFAAFETEVRKERQREGIEAAKARGVYTGNKALRQAKMARASRLLREGKSYAQVEKMTGVTNDTLRRKFPQYVRQPWGSGSRNRGKSISGHQAEAQESPLPTHASAGEPVQDTKPPVEPPRKAGLLRSILQGR